MEIRQHIPASGIATAFPTGIDIKLDAGSDCCGRYHRCAAWQSLLFAVTCVLGISTAAADSNAVSLRFNWPGDLQADVTYTRSKVAIARGQQQKSELSGSYTLKTSNHDNGLLIEKSGATADVSQEPAGGPAELQAIVKRLSAITPAYVVSNEGQLIDVTGLEELKQAMQQELQPLIAKLPGDAADGYARILDQALSVDSLRAGVDSEWNRIVSQWLGKEFEPGRAYEVEFTTPAPMLGNAEIPTIGNYEILGQVACDSQPGASSAANTEHSTALTAPVDKSCIELSFNSHFDPDAVASVVAAMLKSMGMKDDVEFAIKMDFQLLLITEPDTLLPHASSEVTAISAGTPDGSMSTSQTETSYTRYRYRDR